MLLQDRVDLFFGIAHALHRRVDRKLRIVVCWSRLGPIERHGHGRTRQRAHTEGRHQQAAMTVLQIIDKGATLTFCHPAGRGGNLRQLTSNQVGEQFAQ